MNVTVWYSEDRESGYMKAGYDEVSYWYDFEDQRQLFLQIAFLAQESKIGKIDIVYRD